MTFRAECLKQQALFLLEIGDAVAQARHLAVIFVARERDDRARIVWDDCHNVPS
jgi:hypothetical protein